MHALDILRKAREMLSKPAAWTQAQFHDGLTEYPETACKWCLDGALRFATFGGKMFGPSEDIYPLMEAQRRVAEVILRDYPDEPETDDEAAQLHEFNDQVRRRHDEVLNVLDEAIVGAELELANEAA